MKTGKTIVELAQEIERQAITKKDYLVPSRNIGVTGNCINIGALRNGVDVELPLTELARDQLLGHCEIPVKYAEACAKKHPKLLDYNINEWMSVLNKRLFIRELDGNCRALLSDKYRPLDNYDVAESVLPALMNSGAKIESCEVTPTKLYIKAVTDKVGGDIGVNDIVQAGLSLTNSEVGKGRLEVRPLIYRKVCANGMIVAKDFGFARNHIGSRYKGDNEAEMFLRDETQTAQDKVFWMQVRDLLDGFFQSSNFEKIIAKFKASKDEPIERDLEGVIEVTTKRFSLNESEGRGILHQLIQERDNTKFGLINAVTAYAQTVDSYDRATDLEQLGGSILELPKSEWRAVAMN